MILYDYFLYQITMVSSIWSDTGGTLVNGALLFLQGGSLEITLTVPLKIMSTIPLITKSYV